MSVLHIHLQTNAISTLANEVTTTGNLREKSTWQKIKTMFGRYGRSNKVRTAQAEQILSAISKSPHPVLAGGDFNDIPTTVYELLGNIKENDLPHLEINLSDAISYSNEGVTLRFVKLAILEISDELIDRY